MKWTLTNAAPKRFQIFHKKLKMRVHGYEQADYDTIWRKTNALIEIYTRYV